MKNQRPTPPTISAVLTTTFFQSASELYKVAPWESFHDSEIFGVVIPEKSEMHFTSIMGSGGQCFGLGTNRGI